MSFNLAGDAMVVSLPFTATDEGTLIIFELPQQSLAPLPMQTEAT